MLFDNFFKRFSDHKTPPHHALGRYRHTSFSRQIHNIFCWLEILNYCPDGGNGNFHYSLFLKPLSNLWSSIIFCGTSEIFIFLWNRKPWLDNFTSIIRDILFIKISRGASNCVQHVFEKKIKHYHNDFSPFKILIFQWKLIFFSLATTTKKNQHFKFFINNAHLFSQPSLIILTKGTSIYYQVCIYIYIYIYHFQLNSQLNPHFLYISSW